MVSKFLALFLVFIIYSMVGWIMEIISIFKVEKKFINRGFLIGPYCPIYGVGAMVMTLLLTQYRDNIFVLFGMSLLICTILEYITSYVMEKFFKARWWDYHDKKFNLNGRVCLNNAVLFGIAGVILIEVINKIVYYPIINSTSTITTIISIIVLIIFITDLIISYITINSFKNIVKNADATEEIVNRRNEELDKYITDIREKIELEKIRRRKAREEFTMQIKKELYNRHSYLKKRLVKAFPSIMIDINKKRGN